MQDSTRQHAEVRDEELTELLKTAQPRRQRRPFAGQPKTLERPCAAGFWLYR